jgi:hypothetical protein
MIIDIIFSMYSYIYDTVYRISEGSKHMAINLSVDDNLKNMFFEFSIAMIDCCFMLRTMDKCALLVYLRNKLKISDLRGNKKVSISEAYDGALRSFDAIVSHADFKLLRMSKFNEIADVKPLFDLIYMQFTRLFENVFYSSPNVMKVVVNDVNEYDIVRKYGFFDYKMMNTWNSIFDSYIKGINFVIYKVMVNKFEFFYTEFELERLSCGEFIEEIQYPFNINILLALLNGDSIVELPYSINKAVSINCPSHSEFKIWLTDFLVTHLSLIENFKLNYNNIRKDFVDKIQEIDHNINKYGNKINFAMFDVFIYKLYLKMMPSLNEVCEIEQDILYAIMLFKLVCGAIRVEYHILGNLYDVE